mgnify:FL=1
MSNSIANLFPFSKNNIDVKNSKEGIEFYKEVNSILDEWKAKGIFSQKDYEYMFLLNCKILIENQVQFTINKKVDVYINKLDEVLNKINE